jgi:hypothetical protein
MATGKFMYDPDFCVMGNSWYFSGVKQMVYQADYSLPYLAEGKNV